MQEIIEGYELSPQQKHIWLLQQSKSNLTYSVHCRVLIEGSLKTTVLQEALHNIVARHEILHTSFRLLPGMMFPLQAVMAEWTVHVSEHDLCHLSASDQEAEIETLLATHVTFDESVPAFNVPLARLDSDTFVLLLRLPALYADTVTLQNFVYELSHSYEAHLHQTELDDEPFQYIDFSEWQNEFLNTEEAEAGYLYWQRVNLAALSTQKLPFEKHRDNNEVFKPCFMAWTLPAAQAAEITKVAQQLQTSPEIFLLGCWQVLLWRLTAQSDMIIGTDYNGRNFEELEDALGLFVRALPIRQRLNDDLPFGHLIQRNQQQAQEIAEWQSSYSWAQVDGLGESKDEPYFPFAFAYETQPTPSTGANLSFRICQLQGYIDQFTVKLACQAQTDGSLVMILHYDQALLNEIAIKHIRTQLDTLLIDATTYPERPIQSLQILSQTERQRLLVELNQTKAAYPNSCLHDLFQAQVAHTANNTAVIFADQELTYTQLNNRANQLAHYLQKQGIGPETRVAIYTDHTPELLIGLLGILKAGGAYVPITPTYPPARIAFMLQDSQATLLLTQSHLASGLPEHTPTTINLDTDWSTINQEPTNTPFCHATPDNLAYIIYTSGSTGQPKGVMIPHRGLVNYLHWSQEAYAKRQGQGTLVHSPIGFDLTVTSLFVPLLTGQSLKLLSNEQGIEALGDALATSSDLTFIKITPAHLKALSHLLQKTQLSERVQTIIIGGEALYGEDLTFWQTQAPQTKLVNEYGPTETVVGCCVYQVPTATKLTGPVSIGRPIINTQLYLLDSALEPVPVGVVGELYIGGVGLARGYQNQPGLTAAQFIPHPFSTKPGARLYKTGDLARYRPDGELEFLGRNDQQIKIHGYRIELGEIEHALAQHPSIQASIVTIRQTSDSNQIIAYLVPKDSSDGHLLTANQLRSFLQERLPNYMIPAFFITLAGLPLTPNGKVDRQALPAPDDVSSKIAQDFVAPRYPIEEQLSELWQQVLGVEKIGIHDDFFQLGGHSLLAIQLIPQICHTFNVDIALRDFFDARTIEHLAKTINQQKEKQSSYLPLPEITPDVSQRHQPFPLTDVQQAYWLGRSGAFELGNVGSHFYIELESEALNVDQLNLALDKLIERHDMLRAIVLPDGQQQILAQVPSYKIKVTDLRNVDKAHAVSQLEAIRQRLSHQVLDPGQWPLFEIQASLLDEKVRLHVSFDALLGDAWSMLILNHDLSQFYQNASVVLEPLTLSFRDYVLAEVAMKEMDVYERAQTYWAQHLPTLPARPHLPLAHNPATLTQPRFVRHDARLEPATWQKLKERARQANLTSSTVLLAAFAEVLTVWSKDPSFTINLTLFNRLPLHTQINQIVGDFTSLNLLAVDNTEASSFETRARKLQERLWDDLDHRHMSGVQVLRALHRAQKQNGGTGMPVVFTSVLNFDNVAEDNGFDLMQGSEVVYTLTQTPQVWLDHQVGEENGALVFSWDAVEALFPPDLLADMFTAYCNFLHRLATEEAIWQTVKPLLVPEKQLETQTAVNDTQAPLSDALLQTLFTNQVSQRPQQTAVIAATRTLTYAELQKQANQVGHWLQAGKVRPNTLVAVVMEKGWEQIVAVLGILQAGAAYLPIDPALPAERRDYLLQQGKANFVLTQPWLDKGLTWPASVQRLPIDDANLAHLADTPLIASQQPEDLAYVIFTSGSTGLPKGVMIDHRGAVNTILDINERFSVTEKDSVLALSSLSFDLSVYDIFGLLAAGGTIVLPDPVLSKDPAHWAHLVAHHEVTIWNSVPALKALLVEYMNGRQERLPHNLRLVMLSGDWIPVKLPQQIRDLARYDVQIISLGGATEASIWSILYPIQDVDPDWKSIPYGRPMRNQQIYVLDHMLQSRPTWVPGELYIGGVGVAKGYWRDEEKTQSHFIIHPQTGQRLYRTGDLGRYLPDGNIEFLGREDLQVKIQGYRIELGEIEANLHQHSAVHTAIVTVQKDAQTNARLVAYVIPQAGTPPTSSQLREFLQQKLPHYMVPSSFVFLEELPLSANGKVDRQALPQPSLATTETAQPAAVELTTQIAQLVCGVLTVDKVDIDANLIAQGANSVDMIRIANALEATLNFRPQIDAFYRNPTVKGLVHAYQEQQTPAPQPNTNPLVDKTANDIVQSFKMILDPVEREAFKNRQRGLRLANNEATQVPLAMNDLAKAIQNKHIKRHSHRLFDKSPLAFNQFSAFLSCLQQVYHHEKPKYFYPSAGGLYPVQTYVHVKPDRIEKLASGVYYYHPAQHNLVLLSPAAELDPTIHEPFVNRPIFEEAAFSIFLITQYSAIAPLYGEHSVPFSLLEAGYMSQLMMQTAVDCQIGLCPIGGFAFDRIRHLFQLDENHMLVHSLLGGGLDEAQQDKRKEPQETLYRPDMVAGEREEGAL